jgi:hypothetical protein
MHVHDKIYRINLISQKVFANATPSILFDYGFNFGGNTCIVVINNVKDREKEL